MSQRTAYLCGDWIPEADLAIAPDDLGFTLGVTVTERLRTFDGKVFRKPQHLARLARSLEVIGLWAEALVAEFDAAIDQFLLRHRDLWLPGDDWAIVLFATPGRGHGPTTCVQGFPLHFADWAHQYDQGVSLRLSQHRQVPPNCWPAELKCRSRMHYYLADLEARKLDPTARALLLDQQGFIGEASTANVVAWLPGRGLVTPRYEKVLPGVSMAVVEELATAAGIPFSQQDMTPAEFLAADEVWLTSTSVCILPVTHCDGAPIGTGAPGPLFTQFLAAWSELVGVDIREQATRGA